MDVHMFLARGAAPHDDGTISVLRGWLDKAHVPATPALLTCAIVTKIAGHGRTGASPFRVEMTGPEIPAPIVLYDKELIFVPTEAHNVLLDAHLPLIGLGEYTIRALLDGVPVGSCALTVSRAG